MEGAPQKLLQAEMLKQDLQESKAVVGPTGLLLHQVDEEYRGQLASVTPSN